MSALKDVPVFYRDQDEVSDPPCRTNTRDECRQMKREGVGYFFSHGRKFRLHAPSPKIAKRHSPGESTPTTISLDEMLANVGITESWEPNPARKVFCAREKIRLYPFVSDTNAPLARLGS